ncbi:Bug family tripartite tricarboxylate transporter substrate binding protein [Muricoccus radiodurans]|uniref:Bug family tripartite tricarboxylate transporter substrate binding protein n=1 Tax=Muricoccus radiodurans TaxID=2231721 RepID=UPI003CFB7A89
MLRRRTLLRGLSLAPLFHAPCARAQSYPARPIRFVVGSSPGGAMDATGRSMAPKLSTLLGQSVVVDNRSGGGGALSLEAVAHSAPDGHTMLLSNMSTMVVNPIIQPNPPFRPAEVLAPVSLAVDVSTVLVVPAGRPWRSVGELLSAAREKANGLSWGHSGVGATNHLSGALLDSVAGIQTVAVPYRGGGPLSLDLIGGRLDYAFATVPSVLSAIRSGQLRALAVPMPRRSRLMPEVPTVAESGLPGYEVLNWYGLLVHRATPRPIVERLATVARETLEDPGTVALLERQGLEPLPNTPEEFADFLVRERRKWEPVVRAADMRTD